MRLAVSGGGTGGHVYPALTVVETLLSGTCRGTPEDQPSDVVWVGSQGGIEEEIVANAGLEFVGLPAGGVRGMGPWLSIRNSVRIAGSVRTARQFLRDFAPDVVFVTGGYACVSVTLAARMLKVPVMIYLPDVVPGRAIRALARFAARIAVTSKGSQSYFPGTDVVVTGYPVRPSVFSLDREEARQQLGLDPLLPALLVFGGSRGAHSINQAVVENLDQLLEHCQIVHVSGRLDADWVRDATTDVSVELRGRYHMYDYLHDMPFALAASDLAVARAGASTMGEFPAAGLPAVLVPYPYSGQHQNPNAEYLAGLGAAQVLQDRDLGEQLVPTVLGLLGDCEALHRMRTSAQAMARPEAAKSLVLELQSLSQPRSEERSGVEL